MQRLIDGWRHERPDLEVTPVAIAYRVGRLAAHFATEIEQVFTGSGISSADFAVLANLRRSGRPYRLTQRQLMDALRLTSGTVSVRIDRLEARGLVRRDASPDDARGVLVTLTDEGGVAFDDLAPRHLANEARLLAALDAGQQEQLAGLLHTLLLEFEVVDARPDDRLGLRVAPAHVGQQRRAAVGLPAAPGLLVDAVRPGGPAAAAGIQVGDLLWRSGAAELRSLACLARAVGDRRRITVEVRRGNEELTTTVEVLPGPGAPEGADR